MFCQKIRIIHDPFSMGVRYFLTGVKRIKKMAPITWRFPTSGFIKLKHVRRVVTGFTFIQYEWKIGIYFRELLYLPLSDQS